MWYSVKQSRYNDTLEFTNKYGKKYVLTYYSSSSIKPNFDDIIYLGYDCVEYSHVKYSKKLMKPF